jgi:hypothetical protein
MSRKRTGPRTARVVRAGLLYSGTPRKVVGIELEHPAQPGWRFFLDLALDGTVLALAIRPEHEDAPPVDGIQTTTMLRSFPLEALVKAARRSIAELLDALPRGPMRFVEVDELGTPIAAGTMTADAKARAELEADAAVAATRSGLRRGPRRLTDEQLARECREYLAWVEAGGSVSDFCKRAHMSTDTFENHRREAARRGLFEGLGKKGKPGGRLKPLGVRALQRETER